MQKWFMCVCLAAFSCSSAIAEDARRNVLLIISDDLNNLLGCYGDPQVKTPNIDRLATRGVLFNKAYCSFPLCGPSRNSLLTGLYPNSTGIHANGQVFRQTIPKQLNMPQAFRQQAYFAARIGKLYHYNVPNSIGTNGHDDPGSWEMELNPAGVDRLEEHPHIFSLIENQFGGTLSWYASPKSAEHHTDALMANDADWVLERCAREKQRPFFLAVGFFRPHTPYVAPKSPYFDMYKVSEMPVVQVTRGGRRRDAKNGNEVDGPFFGYSLRTPRWRYTEWDGGDAGRELYDHDNDPRELTNLAENDEHNAAREELAVALKDAVASALPPDGKIPELQPGTWAPLLVDP